jgi:hypothetical protein
VRVGEYPDTAAGCSALIGQRAHCNQNFFNYAARGDRNCGCITDTSSQCAELSSSSVVNVYMATHECQDCPVGSFSDSPGSTSCTCEAGWYKGTFDEERVVWGQDECSSHGKTCANPDSCYCWVTFAMPMTACEECPANTFSSAGATACQDCPLGTFSEAGTGCGCSQCEPGTYRGTVDQYRTKWGEDECSAHGETCIPAGSNCFCNVRFTVPMDACEACPAGGASAAGASACLQCADYTTDSACQGVPGCSWATSDDSCRWSDDGMCDEPSNCDPGTDATDCGHAGICSGTHEQVDGSAPTPPPPCGRNITGCDGVANSGKTLDECGVCDGGGVPAGQCDCDGHVLDECNVCNGDGTTCAGCDGVANSGKTVDECGVCDGGGVPAGQCDCDGHVLDECNVCNGDNTTCAGCDGVANSGKTLDS